MGKAQKFIFFAGGIFVSFYLFGIIQEKLTKAPHVDSDGNIEYFTCSMSLVLCYCAVNYVLSFILKKFMKEEDSTPTIYFGLAGVVYFLAMVTSNLALQFINYPTQVVAKSCKPIPVMIFGVLLGKKSYSFKKYIFVGLVVLGVIMFLYKESKEKKDTGSEGLWIGELLVFSSLFMDGLVAAAQERMRSEHQTKPVSLMINLNKWAVIYLSVLWVITKEVFKFFAFIQKYPSTLWKLCTLSMCGFFGQLFMLMTVVEFGTLPASMVATVRKFFTVLTSVFLLGNSLIPRQWIATVIIFTGLFLDILYGKSDSKVK